MAADSLPFGRVGVGCDSLSSAALQIKSQEPSLRGKVYYPPESPKGGQNLLAQSSPEVCSATLHTHLPRARSQARLFLTLSLQSQTRPEEIIVSGHAIRRCGQFPRYAETVRISLVPRSSVQTLLRSTAFRGVI